MNEVEQSDRDHLIRLRIALHILGGVIPFGTLENANLKAVTRPIAEWAQDLEEALIDLDDAPPWDGWVPVARRKPEEGTRVLFVYTETFPDPNEKEWRSAITVGCWDDPEGWYDDLTVGDGMRVTEKVGTVTHWCPFPALPGAAHEEDRGMTPAEIALSKIRGILIDHEGRSVTPDEAVNIVADLVRNTILWRCVDRTLPDIDVRVLVRSLEHGIFIGTMFRGREMDADGWHGVVKTQWLNDAGVRVSSNSVTHWRPIPKWP